MASNRRHLKRTSMPNSWPVKKKTITFISRPNPGSHKRDYVASVLLVLRDVLGYAKTSKEAKYITHNQQILVNGKEVKDIKFPVGLFDVFEIPLTNEKYTLLFDEVGRIRLVKTTDDSIYLKVAGKTQLKGGKLQLNFMNGHNILVDEKTFKAAKVEDTVVYDFKKKKTSSTLSLKEGSFVYMFDGKFKGQLGEVKGFTSYNGLTRDVVQIAVGKEVHNTAKDYCYVIGSKKDDMKRFA